MIRDEGGEMGNRVMGDGAPGMGKRKGGKGKRF